MPARRSPSAACSPRARSLTRPPAFRLQLPLPLPPLRAPRSGCMKSSPPPPPPPPPRLRPPQAPPGDALRPGLPLPRCRGSSVLSTAPYPALPAGAACPELGESRTQLCTTAPSFLSGVFTGYFHSPHLCLTYLWRAQIQPSPVLSGCPLRRWHPGRTAILARG